jgi:hypothetical protein
MQEDRSIECPEENAEEESLDFTPLSTLPPCDEPKKREKETNKK